MAQEQGKGKPDIGPLYIKQTTGRTDGSVNLPGALEIFGALSVTSQFKVALHLTNAGDFLSQYLNQVGLTDNAEINEYYNFYCSDAALPGATFDTIEEIGSRQGVLERFPNRRVYAPFTMTFYVDKDYRMLRLFEEWMNYINPIYGKNGVYPGTRSGQGDAKDRTDFFRFRYPNTYKRTISIVKFERNFLKNPGNLTNVSNQLGNVPSLTYRMIEAFPTNITAIPVTYEGSTITKTTVTFDYNRYVIEYNKGTDDLL